MPYFKSSISITSVLFSLLCFGQGNIGYDSKIISEMSRVEKVGQLFILGFVGTQVSLNLKNHLSDLRPGGVILFRRNLLNKNQLKKLTQDLQNLSKIPLFVAVDQEGGVVNRVPTSPKLPSATWLGDKNSPELTEQLGKSLGSILLNYGINMNLAPVLDVGNSKNGFLKSRSYSKDPVRVAEIGAAFSRGLASAGVLPTSKHFPGLGSISTDLHKNSASSDISYNQFSTVDLVPFQKFFTIRPSAVMLSHASYPAIDPSNTPATLSSVIVNDLLRSKLGFDGIVITDDMLMNGLGNEADFDRRLILTLNAGADLLLFAWSPKFQKRAQKTILAALESGVLNIEIINKKVERILRTKSSLFKNQRARSIASDPESTYKITIEKLKKTKSSAQKVRQARSRH